LRADPRGRTKKFFINKKIEIADPRGYLSRPRSPHCVKYSVKTIFFGKKKTFEKKIKKNKKNVKNNVKPLPKKNPSGGT
jgi:hypothetical protein